MTNALADMSSSLKSVVESSATTLADLVEEARSRIEDLPPLARQRRRRSGRRVAPFLVVAVVAVLAFVMIGRSRRREVDPVDQSSVRHR